MPCMYVWDGWVGGWKLCMHIWMCDMYVYTFTYGRMNVMYEWMYAMLGYGWMDG